MIQDAIEVRLKLSLLQSAIQHMNDGGSPELNDRDEAISLLGMLSQALGKTTDSFRFEPDPVNEDASKVHGAPEPALATVPVPIQELHEHPQARAERKVLSTHQVQEIILQGLRQIPDFPESGVAVTVYGLRPWGAMLSFAPRSTSHKSAITFREALAEIVHELRTTVEIGPDKGN